MDATFYAEHLLAARRPGHSLPQGLYSDAAIFDLDVSLIYHREWLFAGHTCEVPEAGDFLTLRVGAADAVIVRGADGVVRAFHNTCPQVRKSVVSGKSVSVCVDLGGRCIIYKTNFKLSLLYSN